MASNESHPIVRSRTLLFLASVLFHLAVFGAVMNLKFSSPVPEAPEAPPFQAIRLLKVAVPPPPPSAPMPNLTVIPSGMQSPAMAPIPITAPTARFNIPLPDVTGEGSAQHLADSLKAHGLSGTTTGPGNTVAGNGSAQIADIVGLKISTNETLVVIEDVSSSMKDVLSPVDRSIAKYFFGTIPVKVDGCAGKYDPAPSSHVSSAGDFYQTGYPLENADHDAKAPTALVFVSDWEDGDYASATTAFVASLRAHHIKLFLLSVECAPYQGLVDYAKESGGQVSTTTRLAMKALN